MGTALPKPVLSCILERKSLHGFNVGVAEINGWRQSMEDAHIMFTRQDSAFFGIFDGHGGAAASEYVSKEFEARLAKDGCPETDEAMKKLCLDIDQDFLDTERDSGSTAAMCIVHRQPSGKIRLRVANIGDSRVLLGRRDGTIVDGGGTEQGLTTDHKPNNEIEKERIYRCGGHVEEHQGVPRVNGDLAVSRGFGDRAYKKTGGPEPENRPVTANPEFGEFECDESDFLVIVCDGVSEGEFPNQDVVKHIAEAFQASAAAGAKQLDPADVSRRVCMRAEVKNSKDNISCMIILFDADTAAVQEKSVEFIPGPLTEPGSEKFRQSYEAMAKRADLSMQQAVEKRYYDVCKQLEEESCLSAEGDVGDSTYGNYTRKKKELEEEKESIGEPLGAEGSAERKEWFQTVLSKWESTPKQDGPNISNLDALMALLSQQQGAQASVGPKRRVKCCDDVAFLKAEVDKHSDIKWDDRMQQIVGAEGILKDTDDKDDTYQVNFPDNHIQVWLPMSCVTELDDQEPEPTDGTGASSGGGYDAGSKSAPI